MTPSPAPSFQLAMRRVAARIVDLFTVFFLTFALAVTVLFVVMAPLTRLLDVGPWGTRLAPTLLFVVVAVAYETTFVSRRGQTPGRDLLNVKVLGHDGYSAPSTWTAFARALCWGAVALVPDPRIGIALAVASVLWLLVDPAGRGPHDRLVGTSVIPYDADIEEGPIARPRRTEEIEDRYGPRSLRALVGMPKR